MVCGSVGVWWWRRMEKSPHAPLCERGDLPEASIDSVMTTQPFLPSTKIAIDPLPHQDKILRGLLNISCPRPINAPDKATCTSERECSTGRSKNLRNLFKQIFPDVWYATPYGQKTHTGKAKAKLR